MLFGKLVVKNIIGAKEKEKVLKEFHHTTTAPTTVIGSPGKTDTKVWHVPAPSIVSLKSTYVDMGLCLRSNDDYPTVISQRHQLPKLPFNAQTVRSLVHVSKANDTSNALPFQSTPSSVLTRFNRSLDATDDNSFQVKGLMSRWCHQVRTSFVKQRKRHTENQFPDLILNLAAEAMVCKS